MLGDLVAWFAARAGGSSRREHDRTTTPYRAAYSTNGITWSPAIGIDLGLGGISVLVQDGLHKAEIDFRLTLGTRIVPCRLSVLRHEAAQHQGRSVHKYALKFVAIAADDYDAVRRFISGAPIEEVHKAKEELAAIKMNADDVARLFPKSVQDRLHAELVRLDRLAPLNPKVTPLVAYLYGGTIQRRGKTMHRLTVESKIVHKHHEQRHRTRFLFDDAADEINILD